MRVLILGGTKYVGQGLAATMRLNRSFSQVYTLSNKKKNSIDHFFLDRNNLKKLAEIFLNFRPEIVIDFISYDKKDSKIIIELLELGVLKSLKHYLVISTFFVYNYFSLSKYREEKLKSNNRIEQIKDLYTKNKIEMEIALYNSKLYHIMSVIRLPFIFSWDDYTNRFQDLCKTFWENKLEDSKKLFKFSMISKNSAIEGILKLVLTKPVGILDLANEGCVDLKEVSKIINNKNKNKKKIMKIAPSIYKLKNDICLNSKKNIFIKKKLSKAIEEEAEIYFKKINLLT